MAQCNSAAQIALLVPLIAQSIRKVGRRFEQGGLALRLETVPIDWSLNLSFFCRVRVADAINA